jgi:A/G-specific adenine glycosylase
LKKLIIKGMDKRYFSDKIVKWYEMHKRALPWRETNDPYKIWLSEIILQQTRVTQGLPYYNRFINQYPDVKALASASEQEVLRLWQGLGYYTRARNLQRCAKAVVEKHNAQFPGSFGGLVKLPGIGEYTAAAVASIAFKEPVAVVDGNVFRVLARIFGIDAAINSIEGKRTFAALAGDLVDKVRPDIHNQAVMEFGALFCTPQNPDCTKCIFQGNCFAFKHQLQHQLPVKLKLKTSRKRYFYYIVLEDANKLMMRKREQKDIWLGLFDFYLIEKNRPAKVEKILQEGLPKKIISRTSEVVITKNYKHILTHQVIFSRFIIVKNSKKRPPSLESHSFYSLSQVSALPKPVLISRFLNDHYIL